MSSRAGSVIIGLAALALGAGAFFKLHVRADRARSPVASRPMPAALDSAENRPATPKSIAPTVVPEPVKTRPDSGTPTLRSGEVLDYSADVSKLSNVATLRLRTLERREFLGQGAWHLQASAHTENPLRMVFPLDDQFDSYSDAGTFSSLQYEMRLNERGQKVDSIQRMVTAGREPAPANATATHVLPGTRDPLGMMQYLRSVDWSKSPEVRSPVYDGHKLYDVRAVIAKVSDKVAVPAGEFVVSKVEIHVFDNGAEMKDANFALYLANDAARTPVLLEAVLPFASARVELLQAK